MKDSIMRPRYVSLVYAHKCVPKTIGDIIDSIKYPKQVIHLTPLRSKVTCFITNYERNKNIPAAPEFKQGLEPWLAEPGLRLWYVDICGGSRPSSRGAPGTVTKASLPESTLKILALFSLDTSGSSPSCIRVSDWPLSTFSGCDNGSDWLVSSSPCWSKST